MGFKFLGMKHNQAESHTNFIMLSLHKFVVFDSQQKKKKVSSRKFVPPWMWIEDGRQGFFYSFTRASTEDERMR